jgi:magnesium-transporting ATPase (P-type)
MGRAIASIIVGYLLMAILVFISFSVAYLVMGPDTSFKPGSYDVSAAWIVTSIVLSIVAAVAGGYVCAVIARSVKPARILAVVVVVLGLAMAIPALTEGETAPGPRTAEVGTLEAAQYAQQPDWLTLLNPLLGALGVLLGAGLHRRRWVAGRE